MTTTRRSNFAAMLRTTILLASLTGLLVVIGALIGGPDTALLFLGIAALLNLGAYWFCDKIALKMARAKPITEEEAPRLYEIVARADDARRPADAAPLHDPPGPAERLRDRPQPQARGGRRDARASPSCSPRTSCAECSRTSSRTSATATS